MTQNTPRYPIEKEIKFRFLIAIHGKSASNSKNMNIHSKTLFTPSQF